MRWNKKKRHERIRVLVMAAHSVTFSAITKSKFLLLINTCCYREESVGPGIKLKIRATLEELYERKNFELSYSRKTICPHCRGSGGDDPDDVKTCPKCRGEGHI